MANKTAAEIKQEMAIPPIPQQRTKDRKRRDRTRIRMEISVDQCSEFITMIGDRLRAITLDAPEFQSLYVIYHSLKSQYEKATGNKQPVTSSTVGATVGDMEPHDT